MQPARPYNGRMPQPFIVIPPTGDTPADNWVLLACEAQLAEKFPIADRYYRRALDLDPSHAIATSNLAVLKAQTGKLADAILDAERAALFDPDSPVAPLMHADRSMIYAEAGLIDPAVAAADRAIELTPIPPTRDTDPLPTHGWLAARQARGMLCVQQGRAVDAIPYYQAMLAVDPKNLMAGLNICFTQSLLDLPPVEFLEQRRAWRKAHGFTGRHREYDNDRGTDRPLRVGYLGGDFKIHSAAFVFGAVVPCHSPAVESYIYSTAPAPDPARDYMTRMFMRAVGHAVPGMADEDGRPVAATGPDRWRNLYGVSDADAAELIRRDGIDILVDLAGHTLGGRLALMTHAPAPVQVTAWGFALGTGLSEIDVFFADPVAVRADEHQYYAERIVNLPSIVTYRPPAEYGLPAPSPPPYDKHKCITFSCSNRFEKLSDEFLAAVAEIMRRVPDARLILKDHAYGRPHAVRRVYGALAGIDKKRILFYGVNSHPEHMLAMQEADLVLDPWPHGGGIAMLESTYMGVPVVTRYGCQPAGRLAASVLTAMGMPEFIASGIPDYIDKAVHWANRPAELAEVRKVMRDRLLASPVIAGYVQAVESAYRELWKEWCDK